MHHHEFELVGKTQQNQWKQRVGNPNGIGIHLPRQQREAQQFIDLPAKDLRDGARQARARGGVALRRSVGFDAGRYPHSIDEFLAQVSLLGHRRRLCAPLLGALDAGRDDG